MGLLTCKLFTVPPSNELERCAVFDAEHIPPGSRGDHVERIQTALTKLLKVFLEIDGKYGPRTAEAVQQFKEAQAPPLRQPFQATADNIVGIRTIKALDEQMAELENRLPPLPGLLSLTHEGAPHEHRQGAKCAPFFDSDDFQGRVSHLATPINPLRAGKMICIGGTHDVTYLGFEDCVPDPKLDLSMSANQVLGRTKTSEIKSHTCSDICFRSAPVDQFMRRVELKRLGMPGCRLTVAQASPFNGTDMAFFLSLGTPLQIGKVPPPPGDPKAKNVDSDFHVIVISMRFFPEFE
jgi:hypothetical protein